MLIPKSLVSYYLSQITVGYFNHNELPPPHVSGYDAHVAAMGLLAFEKGEADELQAGFEFILSHPEFDCLPLNGGRYPFSGDKIREIVYHSWRTIWPYADPIPPGGPEGVQLLPLDLNQWRRSRTVN